MYGINIDRFVKHLQDNKNKPSTHKVAIYDGTKFRVGNNLILDKEDVLVPDILKFGYVSDITGTSDNLIVTKQKPLSNGDTVLISRLSDELYIVEERLVSL